MVKTPTSTTNPEHRARQRHPLIELLVVLAIGSLLVSLVPSAFDRLQEVSQYRDTVRAMLVGLRQARQQAVSQGQATSFQIDLTQRQFGIEGKTQKPLPDSLEVQATVGKLDQFASPQRPAITFTPDGGSSGGTIELVRKSGAGVRLRVDWLLGQVTQEPRTP
jgi:general secretion pathway protein H